MKGKTELVIAYRMHTGENANKIIVLESGVIAETKPSAKLKHAGRVFQKLLSVKGSLKTLSALS